MEKTRTKVFQEMLENLGVSRETARQAAVTINNDLSGERTERGQRQVWEAWNQSQQSQSQNQSQSQSQSQENVQ